ncbi:BACON domain-containing protein [Bacteroides congonensis]
MKHFIYFTIAICLYTLSACSDHDTIPEDIFQIEGETTYTLSKTGGERTIPVTSTVDYVPLTSDSWVLITEKTESGVSFSVVENYEIESRKGKIVLAAVGFPFITIEITQEAGSPYLSISSSEKTKSFDKEGGERQVSLNTNANYTVIPSEEWISIDNITASGFTLTATENKDPDTRTADVTIKTDGLSDVIINISQVGTPQDWQLKNGWLNDYWNYWKSSGYDMFELASDQWMPAGCPQGTQYIRRKGTLGQTPTEGRILQTLTNVPNGTYTFSCKVAGDNLDKNDNLSIIAIVDGVETKQRITEKKSWGEYSIPVTVTNGTCQVGIYGNWVGNGNSNMSIKVTGFQFIAN